MKNVGKLLFLTGFLLATLFNLIAVWADLEALSFESQLTADGGLALNCPVLVTAAAPVQISATVKNGGQKEMRRTLRATLTQGSVIYTRREEQIFDLAPGQARRFSWALSLEDAAWGRVAMARIYLFRAYPDPSASASCGVFVLPVNLPGEWVTALWLLLAGGLILLGGRAWLGGGFSPNEERIVWVLGDLAALGVFANLMGWFALAGAALLFAVFAALVVGVADRQGNR
ncbi:MAG: hypothetical protein Fur0035_16800 [Anaerolineales bacterium]